MRCATYLRPSAGVVDEDFISGRRFAIFDESDRGITLTVFTRAAAIAALLFAAACGGEPEVLEPDPTSDRTTSSDVVAPEKPAAADEDSESGAATFALYWTDVSDYASLTGDTDELEDISASDCAGCSEYIEYYRELYGAGGRLTGGLQTLSDVTTRPSDDGKVVLVRATVSLAPGTVRETAGAREAETQAERNRVVFRVSRDRDAWVMAELALDE